MKKFGWSQWRIIHATFRSKRLHSLERLGLTYLHSKYALDGLARSVAERLANSGKHCWVSVDSVWIDGTPQAKATAISGVAIKCELADLLFIVEERDISGATQKETALLIQGKVTPKYNKLTSGSSTKKERQLLERVDRSKPLELFRDTKGSNGSKIGSYTLGLIPLGLSDCSRYLLMPKSFAWDCPTCLAMAPFMIGWPKSNRTPFIKSPIGVVEAIQKMALSAKIGKQVTNPSKCEWSRLVNDLRGKYSATQMSGYGGQPRLNSSRSIMCFSTSHYSTHRAGGGIPPNWIANMESPDEFIPPSISIVRVIITNVDQREIELPSTGHQA